MSALSGQVERLTYSPSEAASVLGIFRAKVYLLLDDGTIPSLKLGRRRLIRADALDRVLGELEQELTASRRDAS